MACGQKRSNDMVWSQKVIDIAGENFDILGVHNYEYEPENFETGLRRIRDYLVEAEQTTFARSAHPNIEIGVLEWNLSRTYDWRAGLHAAGSLILYEELSPGLTMTCPALLMRNTTDDPTWTRAHLPRPRLLVPGRRPTWSRSCFASTTPNATSPPPAARSGTFPTATTFFAEISTMKPEGLAARYRRRDRYGERRRPPDRDQGRQLRSGRGIPLLVRLQGAGVPEKAVARLYTLSAGPDGFRVPRASRRDRPGESNAQLR